MRDGAPPTIAVSAGFTDYGDYIGVALARPLVAAGAVPLLLPYLEDAGTRAAARHLPRDADRQRRARRHAVPRPHRVPARRAGASGRRLGALGPRVRRDPRRRPD